MYHPLLLQREVIEQLPALLDERRSQEEAGCWPGCRSEAFAEDLPAAEPVPAAPPRQRVLPALLAGAPLLAAVLGGAAAIFGQAR